MGVALAVAVAISVAAELPVGLGIEVDCSTGGDVASTVDVADVSGATPAGPVGRIEASGVSERLAMVEAIAARMRSTQLKPFTVSSVSWDGDTTMLAAGVDCIAVICAWTRSGASLPLMGDSAAPPPNWLRARTPARSTAKPPAPASATAAGG